MSNIYNLEPPTSGKVVLKTTLGEVDIELWPKEAPLASRNFVQLCLEGYYDNTIFHRVIRDFIVQGGDPTGTGTGGESIYGQPFKDEFHSRLRFSHRGLLACANQNEPHTNGSQFFLTLAAVESLNKKNTIFGKVVGDTIYNAMRLGEVDVDDNDRPLEPPRILSADVVFNPFEDIVPRMRAVAPAPEAPVGKKASAGGRKNLTLLSFGEEAEEEEVVLTKAVKTRIRSAHDVLEDERLVGEAELPEEAKELLKAAQQRRPGELQRIRDKLAGDTTDGPGRQQPAAPSTSERPQEEGAEEGAPGAGADFAASMRAKMVSRRKEMGDAPEPKRQRAEPPKPIEEPPPRQRSPSPDGESSGSEDEEREAQRRRAADGKETGPGAASGRRTYGRINITDEVANADLLKPWQLAREKYKSRKRQLGGREKDTLARLGKFSAALRSGTSQVGAPKPVEEPEESAAGTSSIAAAIAAEEAADGPRGRPGEAGYNGEVREDVDHRAYMPAAWRIDDYLAIEGDQGLEGLRNHRLEFAKSERKDEMATRNDVDDYVVFDPLLEKAKGKFSKTAANAKKAQVEWRAAGKPAKL